MADDSEPRPERFRPANDNSSPLGEPNAGKPNAATWLKIDRAALTLARIVGRRMAREDFERRSAANDNRPNRSESTEDGADQE
ncbi:hypothetical protein [Pseudaminobacter soli (ex Li et al. 2025)]|nr:hypothetical protein [Mesorhizobium soli]